MKQRRIYVVQFEGKPKDFYVAVTTMRKALDAAAAKYPKMTVESVRRNWHTSNVWIPELD
jgi:hypothetical protein